MFNYWVALTILLSALVCYFTNLSSVFSVNVNNKMKSVRFLHQTCRNVIYQGSNITRFTVSDKLVDWSESFVEYSPVFYESPVLNGKFWADPPIGDASFNPMWNSIDGNVNRVSFHGPYEIRDGYPINPAGRTGLTGRGILGKWGPNHAADPLVTRWKQNDAGQFVRHQLTNKKILQMIAIQRHDNSMWAIPGGMVDPGEKVTTTLIREFTEEALNGQKVQQIEIFFKNMGVEIYSGYVDDPRNTDNAWMETVSYNFHDEHGDILNHIHFEAGDDAKNVHWLDIDQHIVLYASHKNIVSQVVSRLNCHW